MQLLNQTITSIEGQSETSRQQAKDRLDQLIMPHWALGRLMDLAVDIAGISGSIRPNVKRKTIVVMAGDHGIVDAGISLYPQELTVEMVRGFVNGVAGINVLARQAGADVKVVDMGVAGDLSDLAINGDIIDRKIAAGTNNFATGEAMSRAQAIRALEAGISVAHDLAGTTDVFGTGDMGIGNTSPSSAIIATFCQLPVADTVGRGTGLDDAQLANKIKVLEKALELNNPDPTDPIDVLSKVGGYEIAGIAGLILGAAILKKPVIVDGIISTAGALLAARLAPKCTEYMIAAHRSVEKGQIAALADMGKEPLLDLQFRLGEGTGAAVAMNLVEGAVAILTEMATFSEATVSMEK
ncbi:nicotinate-nucleotide-dimethylbenzimidazole phosphoribosyltransferase [Desulfuromusa kysingii]|uniref:Nicotinate-nucleotide--dimethylbenzimidazole phosphoribosyltransferase n=1 Tax=Desulfuromusa kysingii TaxID=37625 RepID=A0A1H3X1P7_9BACT|nr:nicotinate-nucleotide--dimethylbenzimidazole phosphoribosyltransferase [Desulfuromusa kysingii]SDZ92911.1 nicotinate-nucleotide-dimethylbenzimidazole phosphoribosyltransferase [Desulfuromusa kysingii]